MTQPLIYVVDDDEAIRRSLSFMLKTGGFAVQSFSGGIPFLKEAAGLEQGCVLLDVRMPDMDGLEVQRELRARGVLLPVIIMTGHGDVASAREAFRSLAIDFLEKPLDHRKLLAGIDEAFSRQQATAIAEMNQDQRRRLLDSLTPRETEVMDRVVAGRHNREIAAELGISPRTVEVHKARMMDKLGVGNVADLVRLNLQAR